MPRAIVQCVVAALFALKDGADARPGIAPPAPCSGLAFGIESIHVSDPTRTAGRWRVSRARPRRAGSNATGGRSALVLNASNMSITTVGCRVDDTAGRSSMVRESFAGTTERAPHRAGTRGGRADCRTQNRVQQQVDAACGPTIGLGRIGVSPASGHRLRRQARCRGGGVASAAVR